MVSLPPKLDHLPPTQFNHLPPIKKLHLVQTLANTPVAASAASASPLANSGLNLMTRASQTDPTRDSFNSIIPAACKDKCKGAAWNIDAFWSKGCISDSANADVTKACTKLVCDALQPTLDCEECALLDSLKQGHVPEDQIKLAQQGFKQGADLAKKQCQGV